MASPIRSSSRGNSSGCGATAAYDVYIGVSFMKSAIAAPTWACCGSISGWNPSCEKPADTSTRRRTFSGCCTASRNATPPPIE